MKRTKIVCTMGPQENEIELMRALAAAGMDVARFNFSHGTHEEQLVRINTLRKVRQETGKPIAMLLDTKGPEIRTGRLKDGKNVTLEAGKEIVLTTKAVQGDASCVSITYKQLYKDVKPGDSILIDDGLLGLKVTSIEKTDIHCMIENGGELGEQKSCNLPGVKTKLPAITKTDKEDIVWGIGQGFDIIAASFIRNAAGVREIKQLLKKHSCSIPVFSKIECAEALENIDEIIEASDGIMVARGDLGVEIPNYDVPHAQKMIIEKCNIAYKPVITATQMLDSMIRNPRPTRAEVTDVANAIYDGTDAIMLSGETAIGKYPVDAVKMMAEIAETTEQYVDEQRFIQHRKMAESSGISSAVCIAAVRTARNVKADAIIVPTDSGQTARLISNFRPKTPIYAVSPNEWAMRRMMVYWGITPIKGVPQSNSADIVSHSIAACRKTGNVKKKDLVVVTAGDPVTNCVEGVGHVTNMLYVIEAK
ncbi:MAG TPA: pyruvate kinase [Lachnospiraceae bacterium]|nr:pyruvate kinase [Lachnospiraceae bacterium]